MQQQYYVVLMCKFWVGSDLDWVWWGQRAVHVWWCMVCAWVWGRGGGRWEFSVFVHVRWYVNDIIFGFWGGSWTWDLAELGVSWTWGLAGLGGSRRENIRYTDRCKWPLPPAEGTPKLGGFLMHVLTMASRGFKNDVTQVWTIFDPPRLVCYTLMP